MSGEDKERLSVAAHRGLQYYMAVLITAVTLLGGFSTYMAKQAYDEIRGGLKDVKKESADNRQDIGVIKEQIVQLKESRKGRL